MIEIFDNLIPLTLQKEIKSTMLGGDFPWFHLEDITAYQTPDRERKPALTHYFVNDYQVVSGGFGLISALPHLASDKINFAYSKLFQARAFLQYPLNLVLLKNKTDYLHIDALFEHLVVIYYVCDSDGRTIIVDKQKENNKADWNLKYSDYPILEKVEPKQGRLLVFDGKYYHTAEQPENNVRCIINFNLI